MTFKLFANYHVKRLQGRGGRRYVRGVPALYVELSVVPGCTHICRDGQLRVREDGGGILGYSPVGP